MTQNTHLSIDPTLVGKATKIETDFAEVLLHTTQRMAADAQGLVHGGFVFGAADYAAMCAVNDPYVVLGASDVRFVAPVRVGDAVVCRARVMQIKGKKKVVSVEAFVAEKKVLEGTFTTFVLEEHVLG
jgi:acyl-coenzyme A thioesterase PaaI-like protein